MKSRLIGSHEIRFAINLETVAHFRDNLPVVYAQRFASLFADLSLSLIWSNNFFFFFYFLHFIWIRWTNAFLIISFFFSFFFHFNGNVSWVFEKFWFSRIDYIVCRIKKWFNRKFSLIFIFSDYNFFLNHCFISWRRKITVVSVYIFYIDQM